MPTCCLYILRFPEEDFIDNDLFTEYPTIAIQNGRLADVPVIAG